MFKRISLLTFAELKMATVRFLLPPPPRCARHARKVVLTGASVDVGGTAALAEPNGVDLLS